MTFFASVLARPRPRTPRGAHLERAHSSAVKPVAGESSVALRVARRRLPERIVD
jgi:hypothetical protein